MEVVSNISELINCFSFYQDIVCFYRLFLYIYIIGIVIILFEYLK